MRGGGRNDQESCGEMSRGELYSVKNVLLKLSERENVQAKNVRGNVQQGNFQISCRITNVYMLRIGYDLYQPG